MNEREMRTGMDLLIEVEESQPSIGILGNGNYDLRSNKTGKTFTRFSDIAEFWGSEIRKSREEEK